MTPRIFIFALLAGCLDEYSISAPLTETLVDVHECRGTCAPRLVVDHGCAELSNTAGDIRVGGHVGHCDDTGRCEFYPLASPGTSLHAAAGLVLGGVRVTTCQIQDVLDSGGWARAPACEAQPEAGVAIVLRDTVLDPVFVDNWHALRSAIVAQCGVSVEQVHEVGGCTWSKTVELDHGIILEDNDVCDPGLTTTASGAPADTQFLLDGATSAVRIMPAGGASRSLRPHGRLFASGSPSRALVGFASVGPLTLRGERYAEVRIGLAGTLLSSDPFVLSRDSALWLEGHRVDGSTTIVDIDLTRDVDIHIDEVQGTWSLHERWTTDAGVITADLSGPIHVSQ